MIFIYSIKNCEYCKKAEILLKLNNIDYKKIDVSGKKDIFKRSYARKENITFPYIEYFDYKTKYYIGGYNELKAVIKDIV